MLQGMWPRLRVMDRNRSPAIQGTRSSKVILLATPRRGIRPGMLPRATRSPILGSRTQDNPIPASRTRVNLTRASPILGSRTPVNRTQGSLILASP